MRLKELGLMAGVGLMALKRGQTTDTAWLTPPRLHSSDTQGLRELRLKRP